MSFTGEPTGKRPRCEVCGEHRWAFDGFCLSMACAGTIDDPMYPASMPQQMRDEREARAASKAGKGSRKTDTKTKVKMPKKGALRSTELYYEAQGKVAPWLEKEQRD